jgi:hypothetical protein
MRDLYDAVDQADALMVAAHSSAILDSWLKLNMETRTTLRADSIFSSLPAIEHLSEGAALPILTAWATMQGIAQQYALVHRDTGERVDYRWAKAFLDQEEIVCYGEWEDDGGAA